MFRLLYSGKHGVTSLVDDAVCGPWPSSGSVNVIRTKTKPDVDAASIRLRATGRSHPAAALLSVLSSLMGKLDI